MNDPIVEKVRQLRDEHAKKFRYDLDEICKDFRKKHKKNIEKLKSIKERLKISH